MSLLRKARLNAMAFTVDSSHVPLRFSTLTHIHVIRFGLRFKNLPSPKMALYGVESLSFHLKVLILALYDQVLDCSAPCSCTVQYLVLFCYPEQGFSILRCTPTSIIFPKVDDWFGYSCKRQFRVTDSSSPVVTYVCVIVRAHQKLHFDVNNSFSLN